MCIVLKNVFLLFHTQKIIHQFAQNPLMVFDDAVNFSISYIAIISYVACPGYSPISIINHSSEQIELYNCSTYLWVPVKF